MTGPANDQTCRLAEHVADMARRHPGPGAVLVGISGIDASGKSTLARRLEAELTRMRVPCAPLSIDWFHTTADVRFLPRTRSDVPSVEHGRHFFDRAFRWDELFSRLVDPLVATGGCDVVVGRYEMIGDTIKPWLARYVGVRVVLLEGVFLFRREYAGRFDLRVWLECPFEVAQARALSRSQEGLSKSAAKTEYARVYFPAQRFHFDRDNPRGSAHVIMASERLPD